MADYDLFNGDADGICSLVQLRLAEPRDATLVTGIKRDIKLLGHIQPQAGDRITVLDVSLDKNIKPLQAALNAGAPVFYADHHQASDIPASELLETHINTAANTCTGLIVDYYLEGQFREWAIVAAYGDNINQVADEYVKQLGLSTEQQQQLQLLGVAMNYNGYGSSLDDLFYHPADLYRAAVQYRSPFDFIAERNDVYTTLTEGYKSDLEQGLAIQPLRDSEHLAMIRLPDEQWARRISGVLGNELANRYPQRAHLILTDKPAINEAGSSALQVSLRAPKNNLTGADIIAAKFGGGGRKGAAGIDVLLESQLDELWQQGAETWC